jgi:PAS domain-containing protein
MLRRGRWLVLPGALSLWVLLLVIAVPAWGAPKCTIVGTSGADYLHGKPGPDVICGRGGNDQIAGGGGADRIVGGPGNDKLFGGPGKDTLLGGKGQDMCRDSAATVFVSCERGRKNDPTFKPGPVPPPPQALEPPDEAAPSVVYLSFGGRYVDTSAGDTEMSLFLEGWDESGIGTISIGIDGPEGPWRQLELEGDATPWTSVETGIDVPASTPPGDYRIASLTISDRKGNTRTLSAAELEEANYPEFEVFVGPDEEGPELTSLSLSVTEVDTSSAPATVNISIGARDDASGVKSATATVALPNWEPGPWEVLWQGSSGEVPPSSGTRQEGSWVEPYPLIEGAMPGYYKILGVFLTDLVGHKTYYSQQKLKELGYPVEFLQSGGGDSTPPEILDFWLEPDHLRTSAGERTIDFYTHVHDDITGFGQGPGLWSVETDFEPPGKWTEFSYSGKRPELVSGSLLDGVWRQEVRLEEGAVPGEYKITYLRATDRAGNDMLMNHAEIEAEGWPTSFVNEP